jgi:antitoxin (DNA-binding transcriptional repressor) of toxin-antitoxin stability system
MTTIGIFEAKNRLCELVDRAARGEEIVITRRAEQISRRLPTQPPDAPGLVLALASAIRRSRAHQPQGDGTSVRAMIEEGRC